MTDIGTATATAIGLLTLLGMLLGWLRWVRPRIRAVRGKFVAASDALVGRDAITDSITGREIAPALPGIGQRMETVERAVAGIADLLLGQHAQDARIDALEVRVDGHDSRLHQLEDQTIERVATRAESAQAWRAIAAVAQQADPSIGEVNP